MNIQIRKMEQRDVLAVKEIEDLSFPSPWAKDAFYREIGKNKLAYYLVAENEGKIAGYLGSWLVLTEAHITNIAVHPDFRGKKTASKLLEEFIKYLNKLGITYATLEVRISNIAAINLYKKFGFYEAGIREKYYADNNEDALLMRLGLGKEKPQRAQS